jgi:hypothetical protein
VFLAKSFSAAIARSVRVTESYGKELAGLFKALLALTRETHIKQLKVIPLGSAGRLRPLKVKLHIAPDLTLEPLATYYLRRAHSYQFVRDLLERLFGPEGLEKMRRLTPDGPVNLPLGEEIHLMQALFHGAYLQVCGEIGMTPGSGSDLENGMDANAHRAILKAWMASISRDPDLGKDVRMMVPNLLRPRPQTDQSVDDSRNRNKAPERVLRYAAMHQRNQGA